MSDNSPKPEHFLPLSELSLHILLSLGTGAAHGYAIGKEVEERSDGALRPTTGALYQTLKRLRDDGLVEPAPEEDAETGDGRRRYFRLTPLGRETVALESKRLDRLLRAAVANNLYSSSN